MWLNTIRTVLIPYKGNIAGIKHCWQIAKVFSLKFTKFLIHIYLPLLGHSPNFSVPKSLAEFPNVSHYMVGILYTKPLYRVSDSPFPSFRYHQNHKLCAPGYHGLIQSPGHGIQS